MLRTEKTAFHVLRGREKLSFIGTRASLDASLLRRVGKLFVFSVLCFLPELQPTVAVFLYFYENKQKYFIIRKFILCSLLIILV